MHQRKNELNGCCGADGTHVELDTQVLTYATAAKKKMGELTGVDPATITLLPNTNAASRLLTCAGTPRKRAPPRQQKAEGTGGKRRNLDCGTTTAATRQNGNEGTAVFDEGTTLQNGIEQQQQHRYFLPFPEQNGASPFAFGKETVDIVGGGSQLEQQQQSKKQNANRGQRRQSGKNSSGTQNRDRKMAEQQHQQQADCGDQIFRLDIFGLHHPPNSTTDGAIHSIGAAQHHAQSVPPPPPPPFLNHFDPSLLNIDQQQQHGMPNQQHYLDLMCLPSSHSSLSAPGNPHQMDNNNSVDQQQPLLVPPPSSLSSSDLCGNLLVQEFQLANNNAETASIGGDGATMQNNNDNGCFGAQIHQQQNPHEHAMRSSMLESNFLGFDLNSLGTLATINTEQQQLFMPPPQHHLQQQTAASASSSGQSAIADGSNTNSAQQLSATSASSAFFNGRQFDPASMRFLAVAAEMQQQQQLTTDTIQQQQLHAEQLMATANNPLDYGLFCAMNARDAAMDYGQQQMPLTAAAYTMPTTHEQQHQLQLEQLFNGEGRNGPNNNTGNDNNFLASMAEHQNQQQQQEFIMHAALAHEQQQQHLAMAMGGGGGGNDLPLMMAGGLAPPSLIKIEEQLQPQHYQPPPQLLHPNGNNNIVAHSHHHHHAQSLAQHNHHHHQQQQQQQNLAVSGGGGGTAVGVITAMSY